MKNSEGACDISHVHAIEVNVTLPQDTDEAAALKAFHGDLAKLQLAAKSKR